MLGVAGGLYTIATVIRIGMARTAARGKESDPQKLRVASLKKDLGIMVAMIMAGGVVTWILLTDGVSNRGEIRPLKAAELAARKGLRIHTIGIGNVEATGEDRVDFEALEQVAGRTGGRFFNAEDETALAEVYREIDEATTADVRTQSWRPRESMVVWPAGIATVTLLLSYTLLLLMTRRREAAS